MLLISNRCLLPSEKLVAIWERLCDSYVQLRFARNLFVRKAVAFEPMRQMAALMIKAPCALMRSYSMLTTTQPSRSGPALYWKVSMFHFWKEEAMSRIPQPAHPSHQAGQSWRPEPLAADYSDDISDENFAALKKISKSEVDEDEFDLVDGPAW